MSEFPYQQLIFRIVLSLPLFAAPFTYANEVGVFDLPGWASSEPAGCKVWIDEEREISAQRKVNWSGACQNGKAAGKGILTVVDDDTERMHFDGEMLEGRLHGSGVLKITDGLDRGEACTTRGSFLHGLTEGKFEQSCRSGRRYEGWTHRGVLSGFARASIPREAYAEEIAEFERNRLGVWQGSLFVITGWWEGGLPQLSCADEAACLPLVANRKEELAGEARREAEAGIRPYLLVMQGAEIDFPLPEKGIRYIWRNGNGQLLSRGVVDNQRRALIVPDPAGGSRYEISLDNGDWEEWEILAECWQRPVKALQACMQLIRSSRTESDTEIEERDVFKKNVLTWALEGQKDAWPIAEAYIKFLAEHNKWVRLPVAKISSQSFRCPPYQPVVNVQAEQAFAKAANLPAGNEQKLAYFEAAQLGSWRAVDRWISLTLDNEFWEGTIPMLYWLSSHQVPATYNRLADVIEIQSNYDAAMSSTGMSSLITSLRWRAALLGDPEAQIKMARWARTHAHTALADSLRDCAVQQNPTLVE